MFLHPSLLPVAFLRFREHYIEKSNHLDDGMIIYNNFLGWRLAANWQGHHKHYDFNVDYSTNRYGFRGKFKGEAKQKGKTIAFIGDSFTFGLGVNDDETGWAKQFLNRFAMFRLLKIRSGNFPDLSKWFDKRFQYKLKLFSPSSKRYKKNA